MSLNFEQFAAVCSLLQTIDNEKETKAALKEHYSQYTYADKVAKIQWEQEVKRKTKPLFASVASFFESVENTDPNL